MHDHGTVKFKLGGTSAQFKPARPMADLTEYEQDLLRRNALLEERAAASIARAKAVVEGSAVLASQEWSAGEIAGKSSLFEDAMLKLARDEVEHFAAGDVTLDSVDYESDDPPPPPTTRSGRTRTTRSPRGSRATFQPPSPPDPRAQPPSAAAWSA